MSIDANYTYNEAWEMKYGIDTSAGIIGSFKGYDFRTEANVGSAADGLRGMEVYGASQRLQAQLELNNLPGFIRRNDCI